MRKNRLPTLEVAVPAFNEEVNIGKLLGDIWRQRRRNFIFEGVAVYSDASTDKTVEIVKDFAKDKAVKVYQGAKQVGKYRKLNQIFRESKADIVVVLDADIGLVGNGFLEKLTKEVVANPDAQMFSAHQRLLKPAGIIPRIIYTSFLYGDNVRLSLPNINCALNYYGSATAYRAGMAKKVRIPKKMLDPHLYLYLMAERLGGFKYCKEAVMVSWPPSTVKDLGKFLRRTLGKEDPMLEREFNLKEFGYKVPRKYKLIGAVKTFLAEPLYTPFALALSFFMGFWAKRVKVDKTAIWGVLTSTKKPV